GLPRARSAWDGAGQRGGRAAGCRGPLPRPAGVGRRRRRPRRGGVRRRQVRGARAHLAGATTGDGEPDIGHRGRPVPPGRASGGGLLQRRRSAHGAPGACHSRGVPLRVRRAPLRGAGPDEGEACGTSAHVLAQGRACPAVLPGGWHTRGACREEGEEQKRLPVAGCIGFLLALSRRSLARRVVMHFIGHLVAFCTATCSTSVGHFRLALKTQCGSHSCGYLVLRDV
ncbi:unnamed protein product, partial [Prorocentrum cordatum]